MSQSDSTLHWAARHPRLFLPVKILAPLGALTCVLIFPDVFWFNSCWAGGVLGAALGFTAGLIWDCRDAQQKCDYSVQDCVHFILMIVLLFALAALEGIPTIVSQSRGLQAFRLLSAKDLKAVEVKYRDRKGRVERVWKVDDPGRLARWKAFMSHAE